jgi:hypothetical protein
MKASQVQREQSPIDKAQLGPKKTDRLKPEAKKIRKPQGKTEAVRRAENLVWEPERV